MQNFRYIEGVSSLHLDQGLCIGCRMCARVCPQAKVMALSARTGEGVADWLAYLRGLR